MKVRGKVKLPSDPVDIAIRQRQKSIARLIDRKVDVMTLAKEDCVKIDKLLSKHEALLYALKAGKLKV